MIRSPAAGYVVGKSVVEGSRVEEGMTLFEVADLSAVWIEADVYEKDLPFVRAGEKIEAAVDALPNRVFDGRVAMIYPQVDTLTRTNRVRFEVQQPVGRASSGHVRHGAHRHAARALIEPFKAMTAAAGEVLAVPERAVIDTGDKQIVYVERSPGLFEGVEVKLGPRVGGFYPVVEGFGGRPARGRRRVVPDRRRNPTEPGRRVDLFRRQRRT